MKFNSFPIIASASLVAAAVWFGQRRGRWDRTMASLKSELLREVNHPQRSTKPHQSWEELPQPVQRYLQRIFSQYALPSSLTVPHTFSANLPVRSLRFKQKGIFRMNDRWFPFTARQLTSALSQQPGFVWEATVSLGPQGAWEKWWPTIEVLDAWTLGQGHLQAALFGVVPLVPVPESEQKDKLLLGEMLRWLAEASLVPTTLFPKQAVVTWKAVSEDKALLQMKDPYTNKTVELTAIFDKDGWMTAVECSRHRAVGKDFVLTPWIGYVSKYEYIADVGMWIPMHMECGWISDDGKEELYFKGDNVDLKYDIKSPEKATAAD